MKKIGVLTYIREYANLGTNMQSYCTLKAIQKQYPDARVELIDYSGWKPSRRPYLSHVTLSSLYKDFVRIRKYRQFFKTSLQFSGQQLISANLKKSIDFIRSQNYDTIYVGSDTLLELKRANKDELTAYWLDKTVSSKKVLIAASSHNVTFDSLTDVQRRKAQETIAHYSLMGVRDEASYKLFSNFVSPGDRRLKMVPDPTFTYEINYSIIENYFRLKRLKFNKPVVCLHLVRNTPWARDVAEKFRRAGYIVASLRPAYYADIVFTDLSPFEQLGLYKYFSLVITHRFHDSIFSIKNMTPVIVYPEYISDVTKYGDNKNKTLFNSFNIGENYIGSRDKLNADYIFNMSEVAIKTFNANRDFISNKLFQNRIDYENFVKESLLI